MSRINDWLVALAIAALVAVAIGGFERGPDLPDQAPAFALPSLTGQTIEQRPHRVQLS